MNLHCGCETPTDTYASAGWHNVTHSAPSVLRLGWSLIQVLALQVTARYRNFFGEILCYSISVLDDADEEVNLDDVQPKEICMHFPPGSRVNIKWKRPVQVSIALPCTMQPALLHLTGENITFSPSLGAVVCQTLV